MKKSILIILIIVFTMALIFPACATPATSPAPSTKPATASSPTPVPSGATSAAPAAAKTIELRLTHHSSPTSSPHTDLTVPWVKMLEDATKGYVKVTIYPAESLAKSTEAFDATKNGVAQIGMIMIGMYPGRFPLTEVTALPFMNLPSGKVNGRTFGDPGINSYILQDLYDNNPEIQAEWADVKVLFFFTTNSFDIHSSKPVRNQADLKGMKIRTPSGPPLDFMQLLGAVPITLPLSGTYDAASKGIVTGSLSDWQALITNKLYEIFHYVTDAKIAPTLFAMVMNKETWNSLPPDIQSAVMSVSGHNTTELDDKAFSRFGKDQAIAEAQKNGYKVEAVSLDSGEIEKWKQIGGKPLWDAWVKAKEAKGLAGQKIFDAAMATLEKCK